MHKTILTKILRLVDYVGRYTNRYSGLKFNSSLRRWLINIVPLMQDPPTTTTESLIEELESLQRDLDDSEDKYKFFSERFKAALDLVRSILLLLRCHV